MTADNVLSVDDNYKMISAASIWCRYKYNVPAAETMAYQFGNEFNCTVRTIADTVIDIIEFKTPEDKLMFILKWA
jgi:hypothetical protein